MSSLKSIDRVKIERFLGMGGGYVCDFADRTFGDFVLEITGVDVYSEGYMMKVEHQRRTDYVLFGKGNRTI